MLLILQIKKEQVDYFGPGKIIPHYELVADHDRVNSPLIKLFHRLSLIGIEKPNIITINIDPSQIGNLHVSTQTICTHMSIISCDMHHACSYRIILDYSKRLDWTCRSQLLASFTMALSS